MIEEYMKLPLEEIDKLLKENSEILDKIWDEDDGSSWEKYEQKCKPYLKVSYELSTAKSLLIPYEDIKFEPIEERFIEECLIPIDEFRAACMYSFFTSYDGSGYYATETEESNIEAIPEAFADGYVRDDFKYVVWYNK
jgi:hypothetical protein